MLSKNELDYISSELGRPARGCIGIAARDEYSNPTVILTNPIICDKNGKKIPFPTFYYLIDKKLIKMVSKLEATGFMNTLNDLIKNDSKIANDYKKAHYSYIKDREKILKVDEISDFSAGGMPHRVKCLHAILAHTLATGTGVNPIGDLIVEELKKF